MGECVLYDKYVEKECDYCVIDCEKIGDVYYGFDVLVMSGRDVRNENFVYRYNELRKKLCDDVEHVLCEKVCFRVKKYWCNDVRVCEDMVGKVSLGEIAKYVLTKIEHPYELDGLIF